MSLTIYEVHREIGVPNFPKIMGFVFDWYAEASKTKRIKNCLDSLKKQMKTSWKSSPQILVKSFSHVSGKF